MPNPSFCFAPNANPLLGTDRNLKAFAFANPGKLAKQATRSHDVRAYTLGLKAHQTNELTK